MAQLIVAGAFAFFAIILCCIGAFYQKSVSNFEKNKKSGTAEIVGYQASENSRRYKPIVKVLDLNDGKTYICSYGLVKRSDYPVGTIINVEYMSKIMFGVNTVEVHMHKASDKSRNVGKFIIKLSMFLFAISAIIMIWGITQIL